MGLTGAKARARTGFTLQSTVTGSEQDDRAQNFQRRPYNSWEEELREDQQEMDKKGLKIPHPLSLSDPSHRAPRRGSSDSALRKGTSNSRSRSVKIKLQGPRFSPSIAHKTFASEEKFNSLPDVRERSSTFSGSPLSQRRMAEHTEEPATVNVDPEESDELLDEMPEVIAQRNARLYSSRRNSFLYQSEADDLPLSAAPTKTAPQIYSPEETHYVTPFAQILSNLYRVRSHFITLTKLPLSEERRKSSHWSPIDTTNATPDDYKALALSTLNELDWCLHKLESVNSAKSMGTMAQDKFRRLLSRELSHLSERSRSGQFVAEWVNTLTGSSQYDAGEEIDKALEAVNVVESTLGIDTTKSRSTSVVDVIPSCGVSGPNVNEPKLMEFLSTHINKWEFDAFQLNYLAGGRPLVACAYNVFTQRGLFPEFNISKTKFIAYMTAVESNYWEKNPYHNSIHASDVLHATNYLLDNPSLQDVFSSLEILAGLVAAAVHDVDHPGRNNQFLINTSHELAIMYNDESVLENHHLAVAFKLLKEDSCNFLCKLEPTQLKAFRKMMIDNVLATDMNKHFKHLGELKTMVETKKVAYDGILTLDKYSDRSEVLQCLLHCADLNNPAKPHSIAHSWAERVLEESFQQGDEEKKLGIDMSPLGDRDNISIEKCQVSFIDYIIYPLWETWAELVYPHAQHILQHLANTREYWNERSVNSPPPADEVQEKREENDESASSPDLSDVASRRCSYRAAKNANINPEFVSVESVNEVNSR